MFLISTTWGRGSCACMPSQGIDAASHWRDSNEWTFFTKSQVLLLNKLIFLNWGGKELLLKKKLFVTALQQCFPNEDPRQVLKDIAVYCWQAELDWFGGFWASFNHCNPHIQRERSKFSAAAERNRAHQQVTFRACRCDCCLGEWRQTCPFPKHKADICAARFVGYVITILKGKHTRKYSTLLMVASPSLLLFFSIWKITDLSQEATRKCSCLSTAVRPCTKATKLCTLCALPQKWTLATSVPCESKRKLICLMTESVCFFYFAKKLWGNSSLPFYSRKWNSTCNKSKRYLTTRVDAINHPSIPTFIIQT